MSVSGHGGATSISSRMKARAVNVFMSHFNTDNAFNSLVRIWSKVQIWVKVSKSLPPCKKCEIEPSGAVPGLN